MTDGVVSERGCIVDGVARRVCGASKLLRPLKESTREAIVAGSSGVPLGAYPEVPPTR
jgi:hypothetical protein